MKNGMVAFLAFLLICTCPAAEKMGFEWSLSVWTEILSWSEEYGFNLVFRSWNKPMLAIQRDDGGYTYVDAVGTGVCLRAGQRYMLTNGRGRSQFFKVCSLPLKEPGFDAPPMFPSGRAVLTFEHSERISRDWKTRHERYVVSSGGDVYDCETKMRSKRGMPMILPDPWTPPDVQARQNVVKAGVWFLNAAREMKHMAQDALLKMDGRRLLLANVTNNVCYSRVGGFGAEEIRKMTKDGRLTPSLKDAALKVKERSPVMKWAQVYATGDSLQVVGITETSDWKRRQVRLYPSGAVRLVVEELVGAGQKAVYKYDETGNLQWQIELTGTKVDEFWMVENGRVNESSDLELAQKLAERGTIEDVK